VVALQRVQIVFYKIVRDDWATAGSLASKAAAATRNDTKVAGREAVHGQIGCQISGVRIHSHWQGSARLHGARHRRAPRHLGRAGGANRRWRHLHHLRAARARWTPRGDGPFGLCELVADLGGILDGTRIAPHTGRLDRLLGNAREREVLALDVYRAKAPRSAPSTAATSSPPTPWRSRPRPGGQRWPAC